MTGSTNPRAHRMAGLASTCSFVCGVAFEAQNQRSDTVSASNYFARYYLAHFDTDAREIDAESGPLAEMERLLEAWWRTIRQIESRAASRPASLRRLRLDYVRAFHPDRLPARLHCLANTKLAEINARIDAAISASLRSEKF